MRTTVSAIIVCTIALLSPVRATMTQVIGSYANWPTSWNPIAGLNDPEKETSTLVSNPQRDLVGDATNPGGYYSLDANYVYFRMRVNQDTATSTTFRDAHMVIIDRVGYGTADQPDYALAWDSKSNDPTAHGLEMQTWGGTATTWGGVTFSDYDGDAGKKGTTDINGGGRTTDGYLRWTDGQSTANFGQTTFIDFAVSWSYFASQGVNLGHNQSWRIQFATIGNATDHNPIGQQGDLAGNITTATAISTGWSSPIALPEPGTATLFLGVLGAGVALRRKFRRSSAAA